MNTTFGINYDKQSVWLWWHWNWSITWRWIFRVARHDNSVMLGFHKLITHQGDGRLVVMNTKIVDFSFQLQPNMRKDDVCEKCGKRKKYISPNGKIFPKCAVCAWEILDKFLSEDEK